MRKRKRVKGNDGDAGEPEKDYRSPQMECADIEIGCMGQSLFLEAVALGLGSRIFANISGESVAKAVGLKENQVLRIAQAVGGVK
jgi:hypothetical protein